MRGDPLTPAQRRFLETLRGSEAAEGFYLAGGSALALTLRHRTSLDHDLFRRDSFLPTVLRERLVETFGAVIPLQLATGTLTLEVQEVRASFFHYPYPLLKPLEDPQGLFPVASLLDIAVMKLAAIADRGARKDFLDLHAILKSGITLAAVLEAVPAKFPGAEYQRYHFLKALVYFEDAKEEELLFLESQPKWEDVKTFFRTEAARLSP